MNYDPVSRTVRWARTGHVQNFALPKDTAL